MRLTIIKIKQFSLEKLFSRSFFGYLNLEDSLNDLLQMFFDIVGNISRSFRVSSKRFILRFV